MTHEKALEAARASGGVVDERAITAYLAAFGVRDLAGLVEAAERFCEVMRGVCFDDIAQDIDAALSPADETR